MTGPAELLEMLSYARPYNSPVEQSFVDIFVAPLGARPDPFGNMILRIGEAPQTLWSSHTDTVHHNPGKQKVLLHDGIIRLSQGRAGTCLGADDAAGVWLMAEMARAKVPGLYVFHRGEEKGGLGSTWIAQHSPQLLTGISHAIALDRKGTQSVITYQMGERCCSAAFGEDLARRLGLGYILDPTGVYTDTANYTHLVPECTNLSVGYEREHGPTETLDLDHILALRDALCGGDFAGLTVARNPDDYAPLDDLAWDRKEGRKWDSWDACFKPRKGRGREYDEDLIELIQEYPETAARLLRECGTTAEGFMEEAITDETL
jgi:hypothetical protein